MSYVHLSLRGGVDGNGEEAPGAGGGGREMGPGHMEAMAMAMGEARCL